MVCVVRRSWWFPFAVAAVAAACSSAEFTTISTPPTTTGDGWSEPVGDEPDGGAPSPRTGREPEPGSPPLEMSRGVTIQVQPSDSGAALLSAIRGAKKSVHMTMYLLTNDAVIDALGDLKAAGKDVKIVLNQTFPSNGGDNEPAYTALTKRGVAVHWAPPGYSFTHAKTIIVDSALAIIMTMNLTYSSAKTNREYIATDTDPQDIVDLENIFDADFTNKAFSLPTKLVLSPATANTVRSSRSHIKALIDSAQKSLDVEVQSLSDPTVVDAIILAHQAKVDVRVVVDGDTSTTPAQLDAIAKLKQNGVPLRTRKNPDMHAKAIVADEERTFVGSHNMTMTALDQNREIGVLTDAKAEATKVRQIIAEDFAKGSPL
ncbi:MAG TPA: phospholipase D-like domain-containing protein [Labilithrix sp.]|nr:phospholipase D-like domain-containing protein [Labilithrix sp.]